MMLLTIYCTIVRMHLNFIMSSRVVVVALAVAVAVVVKYDYMLEI